MESGPAPDLAQCSDGELGDAIVQLHLLETAVAAHKLALIAEHDRREAFRADGAVSMAAWLTGHVGASFTSAQSWVQTAAKLAVLPAVSAAFAQGRLSSDQIRPLCPFVTSDSDAVRAEEAQGLSAAQVEQVARRARVVSDEEIAEAQRRRSLTWRWRHPRVGPRTARPPTCRRRCRRGQVPDPARRPSPEGPDHRAP